MRSPIRAGNSPAAGRPAGRAPGRPLAISRAQRGYRVPAVHEILTELTKPAPGVQRSLR